MMTSPLDVGDMEAHLQGIISTYSPDSMLPLPDGVLSFTHRLVVELARDCLAKYQRGLINETYLEDLRQNVQTLLKQAAERSDCDEWAFIKELAQKVLSVIPGLTPSLDSLNFAHLDTGIKPCKKDFKTSALISSGSFGAVYLVHHKNTHHPFAMKKVPMRDLYMVHKLQQTFLERDIQIFTESPFIVNMICSFESKYHLCMIMEYIGGGDCGTLIKYEGPLPVTLARLYFAEMILALEHLHSFGVIHCDLKPDNLLITKSGHIKVTDFGLSKVGLMRLPTNHSKVQMEDITKEFQDNRIFGSPEYIAPEMLLMEGFGKPIDWWASGIILHEFLMGFVPFSGCTRNEVFNAIIKDDITWTFDNDLAPPEAQDMITELLRKNPAQRLGTGGAHEVKTHPFMGEIDFDCILSQNPEYIPQLYSEEDTSNFEPHSEKYLLMDSDEDDTNEDAEYMICASFVSSSKRYSKLCTATTGLADKSSEDSKSPTEDLPAVSDLDLQKLISSEVKDKELEHQERSNSTTSFTVPASPTKKKPEEQRERRARGSLVRRMLSSCRRRLSRAAHAIRGCCAAVCCRRSSRAA